MSFIPKQTVVVPIDFSDASQNAIETGLEMAESSESLRVLHVIPKDDTLGPGALWQEDHEKFQLEHATKHMATFLRKLGIEGLQQEILFGDPGSSIVKYAKDSEADLIVIPSHGYHGLKRLVLGSVAERVLRHADCPVYVLRWTAESEEDSK
ncbi:MAG: universal stress protein [Planctomycetaceae bacterium]